MKRGHRLSSSHLWKLRITAPTLAFTGDKAVDDDRGALLIEVTSRWTAVDGAATST
jgi:hypothetical protein